MARKSTLPLHKTNPFINALSITKTNKSVRVSPIGKDNNVLIDTNTGEEYGTEVRTWKAVDDANFVKIFSANIALTFELKSAGIKAFNVLLYAVQHSAIEKDVVDLDQLTLDDFNEVNEKTLSLSTLNRGIKELCNAKIIAKHIRTGRYFINPNFVFNGDRIKFTTIIERKKGNDKYHKEMNDIGVKNINEENDND